MYEFLVKGAAGVDKKAKIIVTVVCVFMVAFVAVYAPVHAYAIGMSTVGTCLGLIAGGVLATVAFPELTASIILTVVVSCGANLTIGMIQEALENAESEGKLSQFGAAVAGFSNDGKVSATETTCFFGLTAFNYCRNWVKENIIDYFNEREQVSGEVSQFIPVLEPYSDVTWYGATGHIGGLPYFSINNLNRDKTIGELAQCGYIVSQWDDWNVQLGDDNTLWAYTTGTLDSSGVIVSYDRSIQQLEIKYNDNFSLLFTYGGFSWVWSPSITMPLIDEDNKTLKFIGVADRPYMGWTRQGFDYISTPQFKIDGIVYTLVNTSFPTGNGTSRAWTVLQDSNQQQYKFTCLGDYSYMNTMAHFLYALMVDKCEYQLEEYSSGTEVATGSAVTYTTVNNYYNTKSDMMNTTANSVAKGIESGTITDSTAGTIALTVADTGTVIQAQVDSGTVVTSAAAVTDVAVNDVASGVDVAMSVATAFSISANNIKLGLSDIKYKFPFDVVYTSAQWLNALVTPGEPLVIDYSFNVPGFSNPMHVHIDFSRYQTLVTVGNWIVLVSCAIGCLLATRKLFNAM